MGTVSDRRRVGAVAFGVAWLFLSLATVIADDSAGDGGLPFALAVPAAEADSYSEAVPLPESVIGHRIGTSHTEPHGIVAYFQAVANASGRVTVHEYARSHENRPLIYAVVTSPENHDRLDEIVEANRRISESPAAIGDEALSGMPVIVYQGFSVHGDEASTSEAALLLLYHLAAGEGDEVAAMLEHVVLLIDPCLNPDGRHRFATWVNQNRGATPVSDPADREHRQPWPGGRTNHYWFDLNRDWLPIRHPESRGRISLYYQWRPQLVTDFHEMGSESHYFFQPGVPQRVNRNTPPANQELTARIADYHAEVLDEIGSLYFTREAFDDFYPGKGSTYPDVSGAIGILFEQGASRALLRDTEHGVLPFDFTIRNQFSTSLSTMRAAVALREPLLRYQRDFFADAPALARQRQTKAYVIGTQARPTEAQELVELLLAHQIEVFSLAEPLTAEGTTFRPGEAVVVPVGQPQMRLLSTMMDRQTEFDDDQFYDISTWTLPDAFGLRWAETGQTPATGEPLRSADFATGRLVGGEAKYAYLMRWDRYFAPRALYQLQDAGIRTRVIQRPMTVRVEERDQRFDRGTILVTVHQREPGGAAAATIHETVRHVAEDNAVEIFAVDTGLVPEGPDFGSRRSIQVLRKPEIALVTGSGSTIGTAGETWHLLSERFGIPVSLVDADAVSDSTLRRYNTLVMAGGSYGGLSADAVGRWVRDGGCLIALTSAVDWAIRRELVKLESKPFDLDAIVGQRPFEELSDARGAQQVGGAILEIELDTTHPLAYGYPRRVFAFRNHSSFLIPSERAGFNVGAYAKSPLRSGYLSAERLAQVPGSLAIGASRLGSGRVVLIHDNPNFRAFWYGTNGLFMNAVFLNAAF